MKETIQVEVDGGIAEVVLVTPQALLGKSPIPPIRFPRPPDIVPKVCLPDCVPLCMPSWGRPICGPDVDPKPLPPKPKP